MQESQYIFEARPGSLVGPIDLSKITPETLPTILQRLCDEIQALKTAFAAAEKRRQDDYDKIIAAIETIKVCNEKAIVDYSSDAENLKTFMKVCKFGIAHPWLSVMLIIFTFGAVDYLMRFSYWGIWPK
jgi:hypothetical protein